MQTPIPIYTLLYGYGYIHSYGITLLCFALYFFCYKREREGMRVYGIRRCREREREREGGRASSLTTFQCVAQLLCLPFISPFPSSYSSSLAMLVYICAEDAMLCCVLGCMHIYTHTHSSSGYIACH